MVLELKDTDLVTLKWVQHKINARLNIKFYTVELHLPCAIFNF